MKTDSGTVPGWKGIRLARTRCKRGSWTGKESSEENLPRVPQDPRVSQKHQISVNSPVSGIVLCSVSVGIRTIWG